MPMRIIVDNHIVKQLNTDPTVILANPLFQDSDALIRFEWPSFLEYIGMGSIYSELPVFNHTHKLFDAIVNTLSTHDEEGVVFHIYDHLFAENLKQISAHPRINPGYLVDSIRAKKKTPEFLEAHKILSKTMDDYEINFIDDTANKMHNLILYLAWDRMCVCVSYLFNHQSVEPKYLDGIAGVGDCLIESYQHISQHGRTAPGISRMIETLFYYEMREENLQRHSDAVWELLTKSFPSLKPQDELMDFLYIDNAVIPFEKYNNELYLTRDSADIIDTRITLAEYMAEKLNYSLSPKTIHTLNGTY